MNNFKTILHATYIINDIDASKQFYGNVLGMTLNNNRPNLAYAGLWFDVGNGQIHLLALDNPDSTTGRPEHGGRDRHVALQVSSIKMIEKSLNLANIDFSVSKSGRKALFCRDPDGNALEFIEL
ncbi:Glyoxalase/bleomycin resistance protein/dioxygenase [hydrothermal vent metagenome]|uniref:Glyoxalase/bleomycin resistance protein/dioxygenase n=1 Tax=hydrothermal vent metagenome TaxID=652676 RepID=A0A3B1A557_9ZZZZ